MDIFGWLSHNGELQLIINVFNTFVLVAETLLTKTNPRLISRLVPIYDSKSCVLSTTSLI